MKIAFLNIYQGFINRGSETYVDELAKRLAKKNQVTVFQSGDSIPGFYSTEKISININPSKEDNSGTLLRRVFLDYWSLKVMVFTIYCIPLIIKNRFDIIIPTNGGWQSAIVRIITWLYGGKMVISGQSGIGWDDRFNLWCFPDRFVVLSEFQRKWTQKANPFVPTEKIPNGVDTKKFKTAKKTDVKLSKPVFLCVSALISWKRIDLTIKAISRLGKGSLLIVGKGVEKEKLQRLGEKLLPGRFRILDFKHSDMPEVYSSADVFTFPTVPWESFGIVLVEAMAANLPVVVTNDPIRKEIVGDAGILVDPTDADLYAKALEDVIKKNWGNKPGKQAEKFDWNLIAEKYEKLFQDLTSKN